MRYMLSFLKAVLPLVLLMRCIGRWLFVCALLAVSPVWAASAPDWMRAQVGQPLPTYDEKVDSVMLYSEVVLTVQPNGAIKRLHRAAYKILRPGGQGRGVVNIPFDDQSRILSLRGWCIPATGKDYEVKEKEAIVTAGLGSDRIELASDTRYKLMRIPAAVPGSIVGFEVEQELRPYMKVDEWHFQDISPVREGRYVLQLPAGWNYQTTWLNHAEQSPTNIGANRWQWSVKDVKPIRIERIMPPWRGISGRMFVALIPPSGHESGMRTWDDIASWYSNLARDRRVASPEIKKHVAELTAGAPTPLARVQALAGFVQSNIRYVAIEIGIGGHQPHYAADVFRNRFGDCKDKATLLAVMLKEIGIESYYVFINTERGAVDRTTPPNLDFNHVILAIAVPAEINDASLMMTTAHPRLGRLVFFDPTDELTPFGRVIGALQSNFGVLALDKGGELIELPTLPVAANAVERNAQLTLDDKGVLRGDVREIWIGDRASAQRYSMNAATNEIDRIKPIESMLAESLASFAIEKASISNRSSQEKPFEWKYTIEASAYAKRAGDLLLVRPRVLGRMGSGFLETKEAREHRIEFDRPERHQDVFEIALPSGYEVEELPPGINVDLGFIAYRSKTEFAERKLRYTRTLEIKELSVPASSAEKLKRFYRNIEDDERNVAVLKRAAQ